MFGNADCTSVGERQDLEGHNWCQAGLGGIWNLGLQILAYGSFTFLTGPNGKNWRGMLPRGKARRLSYTK